MSACDYTCQAIWTFGMIGGWLVALCVGELVGRAFWRWWRRG